MYTIQITIILFITFLGKVTAQSVGSLDSLQNKLYQKLTPRQRVDTYHQMAQPYLVKHPQKVIEIAKQSLRLAQSIAYAQGIINAHCLIGWANMRQGKYFLARLHLKQALAVDVPAKPTTPDFTLLGINMGLLLVLLLVGYKIRNNYQLKIKHFNKQLKLVKEQLTVTVHQYHQLEEDMRIQASAIKSKNQQLASHTLHMIQKNQSLIKIRTLTNEIKEQANVAEINQIFNRLDQLISHGLNIDKNWQCFHQIFEQLHPDFCQNLKAKFPLLTKHDLQICSLLKLNINTKDIAEILGIAPNSVKMQRYRLRKKMNLDNQDICEFLIMFKVDALSPVP